MQAVQLILKVRHRSCSWLRRSIRYTQIDSHAILVGPWLRKDERGARPLCSNVFVYQAQLFERAYLITHKIQLRRGVLASRHSHGFCTVAQLDDKGLHIRRRVCANLEPENVHELCHQLSQTLNTMSRHAFLLSARDQTLDSVRQFLWAFSLHLHHCNILSHHQECQHRKEPSLRGSQPLRWAVACHGPRHQLLSAVQCSIIA
jgi:hypothetical protein